MPDHAELVAEASNAVTKWVNDSTILENTQELFTQAGEFIQHAATKTPEVLASFGEKIAENTPSLESITATLGEAGKQIAETAPQITRQLSENATSIMDELWKTAEENPVMLAATAAAAVTATGLYFFRRPIAQGFQKMGETLGAGASYVYNHLPSLRQQPTLQGTPSDPKLEGYSRRSTPTSK